MPFWWRDGDSAKCPDKPKIDQEWLHKIFGHFSLVSAHSTTLLLLHVFHRIRTRVLCIVKSNCFFSIALHTIQIVSKQLRSDKHENSRINFGNSSQVLCCTRCASEQVYSGRKAIAVNEMQMYLFTNHALCMRNHKPLLLISTGNSSELYVQVSFWF